MCCYFSYRRECGAGPNTLYKEYSGIKGIFNIIKHDFISWKHDKSWPMAAKWLATNKKGYEADTAPEFTQAQLTRFKKYPDPEKKFFMLKLCAFFGLNLRLRACEYSRILFENINILLKGMLFFLYFFDIFFLYLCH